MNELTPRQRDVFNAIRDYKARVGFPPTMFELAGLIGCSSPNAAADHVNALKRKGYITVAPGVARGITILGRMRALTLSLSFARCWMERMVLVMRLLPGWKQRSLHYETRSAIPAQRKHILASSKQRPVKGTPSDQPERPRIPERCLCSHYRAASQVTKAIVRVRGGGDHTVPTRPTPPGYRQLQQSAVRRADACRRLGGRQPG